MTASLVRRGPLAIGWHRDSDPTRLAPPVIEAIDGDVILDVTARGESASIHRRYAFVSPERWTGDLWRSRHTAPPTVCAAPWTHPLPLAGAPAALHLGRRGPSMATSTYDSTARSSRCR